MPDSTRECCQGPVVEAWGPRSSSGSRNARWGSGSRRRGTNVDDAGSLAFAERFGYREVDRQIEMIRAIGAEPLVVAPAGVEIITVAERPGLWREAYDPLALQAFDDMALDRPLVATLEQWERDWLAWPEATFLAMSDDLIVGCAGLQRDVDVPERAENALTAVLRGWRGRGIASALKRTTLAYAAASGIREVYTWTQQGNAAMRRLNQQLGYVERAVSISVRAPLPLSAAGYSSKSSQPPSSPGTKNALSG